MAAFAACTIAAKRDLALARVLAASFHDHHPELPFYVLLADEPEGLVDAAAEPFELVLIGELEALELTRMRFHYRQTELTYALTPHLIAHLLAAGHEGVGFFKQESLVTGDLSDIFATTRGHAVTLTPHHLDPLETEDAADREAGVLLAGVYNVGYLGVGARPQAHAFLNWWRARVEHHCRHEVGRGLHYEQRWLNLVPAYFEDVHILRDPGFNVAHWNVAHRALSDDDGVLTADGRPVRFVRFSGYAYDRPDVLTRYGDTPPTEGPIAGVFARYHAALKAAGHEEVRDWPYAYERFDNGVPIPQVARRIHGDLGSAADRFGDPFAADDPDGFFAWLNAPAEGRKDATAGVSNFWKGVWDRRADLQRAFPEPLGAHSGSFAAWVARSGAETPDIDRAFLPA